MSITITPKVSIPFRLIELTPKQVEDLEHYDVNRSIDHNNVKAIIKSMSVHGQLTPIHISNDGYIVDGQHRKVAAVTLGVGLWAIESVNYDQEKIVDINNVRKDWKVYDFLCSHAEAGIGDFPRLKQIISDYAKADSGYSTSGILAAYTKTPGSTNTLIAKKLYKLDETFGDVIIDDCEKMAGVIDFSRGIKFVRSIKKIRLFCEDRGKTFDIERLYDNAQKKRLNRFENERDLTSEILSVYNHRYPKKDKLYL